MLGPFMSAFGGGAARRSLEMASGRYQTRDSISGVTPQQGFGDSGWRRVAGANFPTNTNHEHHAAESHKMPENKMPREHAPNSWAAENRGDAELDALRPTAK